MLTLGVSVAEVQQALTLVLAMLMYAALARLLLLLLCGCHCTRHEYEYGCCVDFYIVKYVTWFLEFFYWHMLNYAEAPGPSEDRGEMAVAIARSPGLPVRSTAGASFSPLYSFPWRGPLPTQCVRCCPLSLHSLRSWSCRPQPRGGCREAASR